MLATDKSSEIKKYEINLMWINKTNDSSKEYLFPGTEEEVRVRVLDSALDWAKQNPDATVCLWYDSHSSTPEAFEKTQALINQCAMNRNSQTIKLMDIRSLPIVLQNPEIFSGRLPVYFRVDLLKLILVLNSIRQDGVDAAIFADLEVGDLRKDKKRLTKEELFSKDKMEALHESGLLLAGHSPSVKTPGGHGVSSVENQYFQLIHHEKMLKALQYVIDLNLTNATEFLKAGSKKREELVEHAQLLCRMIYFTTLQIHQLLTPDYPLDTKPAVCQARTLKTNALVYRAEFNNAFLFGTKRNIPEPRTFSLDGIARQGNSHNVDMADLLFPSSLVKMTPTAKHHEKIVDANVASRDFSAKDIETLKIEMADRFLEAYKKKLHFFSSNFFKASQQHVTLGEIIENALGKHKGFSGKRTASVLVEEFAVDLAELKNAYDKDSTQGKRDAEKYLLTCFINSRQKTLSQKPGS